MGKIGDESLFLGSRKPKSIQAGSVSSNREGEIQKDELIKLRSLVLEDQRFFQSLVATGSSTLFRTHETRVEIDAEANHGDLEYIIKNETITDIVISSVKDTVECLVNIGELIEIVRDIHHVNAVRLRSLNFNYAPEKYTRAVVDKLGNLNKLTTVNPLRLEIETQFLHSSEFGPDHAALARVLRNRGITVYNNTPLLSAVNDNPDEIHEIAYQCRKIGIEFHHLYIAGLPLQESWNSEHPVDVSDVIDIATRIRRDGSGREIPGYIIRTELGEVDFGLTSKMYLDNGQIGVKLLPYELAYYQNMFSGFSWPSNVKLDSDGKPIVVVPGLTAADGFLLS
jgi:L-lysine 2,3-aminomutase